MNKFNSINTFKVSITAVFYPLLIIFVLYGKNNFELKHFSDFVIGIATLENFDIAARITFYYKAIILLVISVFCLTIIFHHAYNFLRPQRGLILCLEYLSIAGLIFLFGNIFTYTFSDSWKLVLLLQLLIYILIGISIFRKQEIVWLHDSKKILTSLFTLSFSLTWMIYETGNLFHQKIFQHFFAWMFLFSVIIIVLILKCSVKQIGRFIYAAIPLLFFQLLSVVKTEMVFILMRHSILNVRASNLWMIGIVIMFLLSIIIYFRKKDTSNIPKKIITHAYLFSLVIGITTAALYRQNFELITEQFELSNPGIAVMNTFKFNMLPYFDYFNTHLVSELFFPFLYSILNNGCVGQEFTIYNFMPLVIANALTFFFILRFSRNSFLAIACSLMLLLFPVLFPFYMFLAGVLSFLFLLKKQTWWSYWLFSFVTILLATWQLDIGFTTVIVFALMITIGTIFNFIKIDWKKFALTFLSVVVFIAVAVFAIAYIRHVDLIYKLHLILEFTGSVQGYGFKTVYRDLISAVQIQYLVFPVVAVLILVYFLLNRKKLMMNPQRKRQIIMLMFLLMYALVNYQRGITRHCFYEFWDKHVSSFLFFAIPASLILIREKYFSTKASVTLFASVIFLMLGFKYTAFQVGDNLVYTAFDHLVNKKTETPVFQSKIERYTEPPDFTASYSDLKKFMDEHFSADATFVDFSNSPVLYMNLNRKCPNYFNQPLFSSQNDYLQREFNEQLKNFDIPVCVYSNSPPNYWDNVDEVPNAVHHSIINQYIFEHYSPYTILNNHAIWLRNDLFTDSSFNEPHIIDAESFATKHFDLKQLPLVQANYFNQAYKRRITVEQLHFDKIEVVDVAQSSIRISDSSRKNEYLLMHLESNLKTQEQICISYFLENQIKGQFYFDINAGKQSHNYYIRLSDQYNWFKLKCNSIMIARAMTNNGNLKAIDAKIVSIK